MIYREIENRLRKAVQELLPDADLASISVRPCPDLKFGDYQTSALMSLAKQRRLNPRQLAADVQAKVDLADLCGTVEIAGAGFLNFKLKTGAIIDGLSAVAKGGRLFYELADRPKKIVIDFSSPNVAKPMHVGHIRSTILGDSLARVFKLLGHKVVTDNHIGDWGTQFGKLLVGWKEKLDKAALDSSPIAELERLYKAVNAESEQDPAVLDRARQELVKLQQGDSENLAIWQTMLDLSMREFDQIYRRLGITFDHALGESFYNPRLQKVVQEIEDAGLAKESEGAMVVFFEDIPELKAHPALIRKRDGAANYTTTDLATLDYRLSEWSPDEIIYVTDGRQQLHFKQLFEIFRRWRSKTSVQLRHVWFGMVLGEDGKPFKTKSGENIKLADLLDEAEQRAFRIVSDKNPDMDEAARREIARIVGIGAIKYADLLPNRQSDYGFSWDKMLALNGATAPYLQYAFTRTQSILRKATEAGVSPAAGVSASFRLSKPEELDLAKGLLNFGLVLEAVASDCRPNYLCNYLYDLAGLFARFFENCPVLKASEEDRRSRLGLCDLTGRVLKLGLNTLGIETSERM